MTPSDVAGKRLDLTVHSGDRNHPSTTLLELVDEHRRRAATFLHGPSNVDKRSHRYADTMAEMRNLYLRAEFKEARARENAVVPTLEVDVVLYASRTGGGQSFTLPQEVTGFSVDRIVGSLFLRQTGNSDMIAGFIGFGHLAPTSYVQEVRDGGVPAEHTLWFPLSPSTVSRIENLRNGAKARFHLELRVSGLYRQQIRTFSPPEAESGDRGHPVAVEDLRTYANYADLAIPFQIDRLIPATARGQNQPIEIDKSRWVEEILPALGFGAWRTYELPVSDDAALGKVNEYVDQAAKHLNTGDWKDSLSRSRDAVQALEPYLRKYANDAYSDKRHGSADSKMAELVASFMGLASGMLDFQSKVFGILSAGSHPLPPSTTIERPDAEFGLTVAMACLRYVGTRMREAPS